MKTLCWILAVFFILGGCAPKSTFEVEPYEKTKDWASFDQNLSREGVYQRIRNDAFYFVFYGKETKYNNIVFEVEDTTLVIRYDALFCTSGWYEIYEIKTNMTIDKVQLIENGKETFLVGVFAD